MTEYKNDKIKEKISYLFLSQKLGVLSTTGKNGPYANLISFAGIEHLNRILFVTPRATHKYANMKEDCRVALLVENSRNTTEDFNDAMAVTATGVVEELSGEERQSAAKQYLEKHPNLEAFVDSDDSALMAIIVKQYVLVEKFQSVKKIDLA